MARKKPGTNGVHVEEPPAAPTEPEPPPEDRHEDYSRPVTSIRYGYVKCCVWRDETEQGVRFNTTFARIYKIGDNDWGQSSSFGARDLPLVEKCAAAALEFIRSQYDETPF